MAKQGRTMKKSGSMGNRPLQDEDGFVRGAYIAVDEYVENEGTEKEWRAWKWTFKVRGTMKDYDLTELTGMTFQPPDAKGKLNKFTLLVVRLGILSLEDILQGAKTGILPDHDLESAYGQLVKCQLYPDPDTGFHRIDLNTLTRDE